MSCCTCWNLDIVKLTGRMVREILMSDNTANITIVIRGATDPDKPSRNKLRSSTLLKAMPTTSTTTEDAATTTSRGVFIQGVYTQPRMMLRPMGYPWRLEDAIILDDAYGRALGVPFELTVSFEVCSLTDASPSSNMIHLADGAV